MVGESRAVLPQQLIVRLLDHVRGSWRYRWWALGVAWVICLAGWIYVLLMPSVYQSSARVYLDSQSALRPLLKGLAVDPDVESNLSVVRQAILSRPHLEKVAHQNNLDANATTPEAREKLIDSLRLRITIEADARAHTSATDGIYKISFQDLDRGKSLKVVRSLLESFVEDTLGNSRTGQEDAQRFLTSQLAEYEQRLSDAETRLSDFKKKNVGMMPGEKGDYFAQLQTEMAGLAEVRSTLRVAEARRVEIEKQLSGEEPYEFGFDSATATRAQSTGAGDLTMRIQALEHRQEELLLRYTENHPEVIAVRDTIAELKQRQQQEFDRLNHGQKASADLSQSVKTNPVYEATQIELKHTNVQVAELKQDLAQRSERVAQLQRLVNTVPEVEAELSRLNRDYEVNKAQYQQLAQRLETAKLSQQADLTGVVKFQVMEPPSTNIEPVAPNRPALLSVVLLAGLGAGLALAYLLNLLHPVFQNARSLAQLTGLQVLGSVSRTWMEREAQRTRVHTLAYCALAFLLVGAFVLVMVFRNAVSLLSS
jgi:polysaccharide chain length determinant protein (PEP-CTERM system associated)